MRWVLCRRRLLLLLEGAATRLGKRTSEPHPDARAHAISAPSSMQWVRWSRAGASSSTPHPTSLWTSQPIPEPRSLPAGKRAETKGARPKPRSHWLRRHHLDKSRTVLQTLRRGGFGPGPARAPAALPCPADPRGAATLPGPPPPPAPRPICSLLTLAPLALKRLDPRPHRCPASFRSAAGLEEALPKQSLVEATG